MQNYKLKLAVIISVCMAGINPARAGNYELPSAHVTQQQTKNTIQGNVSDTNGDPVIGATISIVGSNIKSVTDVNGHFTINVPKQAVAIEVSYIGFETKKINLSGRQTINVILSEDEKSLNEVVVVGYNLVKRSQITGSIEEINGKKIEDQTSATLEDRLQGKVAGLLISTGSGQPGSNDVKIRIRGTGSINGSNTPLYILDGIEVEPAQFASLNTNDIDDIQVLKDASSTAIYGSRGANGVVVITTKQGKSGRTNVSYSMKLSSSSMRDPKTRMMTGEENILYQTYCVQANPNSKAFPLMYLLGLEEKEKNNTITADELVTLNDGRSRLEKARSTNTDWIDVMTRNSFSMDHNLSISGGNEKTQFLVSGSYMDQNGILKGSEMKRYNTRINLNHKVNSIIEIGTNMSVGYSESHASDPGTGEGRYSWRNPWFTSLLAYPYEDPETWYNGDNPSLILKYFNRKTRLLRVVGEAFASARITDWLRFKTVFGIDYFNNKMMNSLNRNHPKAVKNHGYLYEGTSESRRYTWTNTLNLNKTFSKKHTVSGVLGFEMVDYNFNGFNQTGYNLDEFLSNTPAGIGDKTGASDYPPTIGGSKTRHNLLSCFTQWTYSYDYRYHISGSLRYDESSKFVGSNKHAVFWSLGAGWDIRNETFMKSLKFIDQLKLRASVGTNGNQNGIGDFEAYSGYGKVSYNGQSGYSRMELGNPDLKWETSMQGDIGIDFRAFENRLSVSLDYYHKTTKNLLMFKKISQVSGFSKISTNAGEIVNSGIELALSCTPVSTNDFSWTIGGNITYNKNKITDLGAWSNKDNKFVDGDNLYEVGKPLGTWYMVEWAGVNPDDGEVQFYKADGSKTENIDEAPLVDKFKSYEIPWFGGAFTSFSYKGFELIANFSFAFDYYIMNSARWYIDNHAFNGNKPAYMLTMWRQKGDKTKVARFDSRNNSSPWASQFLEDASYLKLKTLRLSYSLPRKVFSKLKFLQSASCFVQGENLFTITDYTGMEPETSSGTDEMIYPTPRVYTFGLTLNF